MNDKTHGFCQDWYENGQLHFECSVLYNKAHGLQKIWHKNGNKENECHFLYDKKHGMNKKWNENGILISEIFYLNGDKMHLINFIIKIMNFIVNFIIGNQ